MSGFIVMGLAFTRPGGWFDKLLATERATHYEGIDGLRSFLAFGVFFAHAQVNLQYHQSGEVTLPASAFYTTLGEFSVSLFFIITAFLFWGKVLRANGRISALRLYQGRNRRLTPMYVVSVLLVLLVVAYRTHFELRVPATELAYQILMWFTYGLLAIPQLPDINGLAATHSIQGVYWTLTFEWEFYLLLPLLALLPFRTLSLCIVMGVLAFFAPLPPVAVIIVNFAFGAIAAWVVYHYDIRQYLKGWAFDVIMLFVLILVLWLFPRGQGLPQYLLGFIFFMLLVSGNTLFGILVSRPVKFLGMISYSIYLLHNIIISVVFYHFNQFRNIASIAPIAFWLLTGACGVMVVVLSAFSYRFVEHPFIASKPSSVAPLKDTIITGGKPQSARRGNADLIT
jgi:peptidoglycan/LPS O-acetylase OafA/YrhL